MTQRTIDEQTVAALDQVRELVGAQALYMRQIRRQLGDLPPRYARLVEDTHYRLRAARDMAGMAVDALISRLDPYDDSYTFRPAEPIEITPNGILPKTTGFVNYTDMLTVQDIPSDTLTAVDNQKRVVNETQKPEDVVSYFRDNRIWIKTGEAVAMRAQVTVTPLDPDDIASTARIGLQIINGGSVIFPQNFPLAGFNVPTVCSFNTTAFGGPNWEELGAAVMIQADGPIRVTSRTLLITRLHKARP